MPIFDSMKKIIISFVCSLFICGCASNQIKQSKATFTPVDRVFAFQVKKENTTSKIIVTRDWWLFGDKCYISFWIDDKLSARLGIEEKAQFYVEPGYRKITVRGDPLNPNSCMEPVYKDVVVNAHINPNETLYYRIFFDETGYSKAGIRPSNENN